MAQSRHAIALCPDCRRDILPQLKEPSWRRDVLRRAADGMVRKADPAAERIRARKDRKRTARTYMTRGTLQAVKLILLTRNAILPEKPSDDCPRCAEMQRRSAA